MNEAIAARVSALHEGRHLLVVDDDDRIRKLLKEFLVRAGFRVSTAADAAGADRLCGALDFDLMVLDVMMPGEDGLSFTRRLRARTGETGKTPILMLTARDQTQDRIEGLSLGVDDYLGKPFEPQELLLRIENILRRSGGRPVGLRSLSMGDCTFDPERGARWFTRVGHTGFLGMEYHDHGEDWIELALPWREDLVGVATVDR